MNREKGFTMIELIMVIVIISILAAVAIPRFISLRRDAEQAACDSNVGALRAALSNYYARTALGGSASFPSALTSASFLPYLTGGALPAHRGFPMLINYNNLYSPAGQVINTHTHTLTGPIWEF